jgi:hypothetical protein
MSGPQYAPPNVFDWRAEGVRHMVLHLLIIDVGPAVCSAECNSGLQYAPLNVFD